MKGIFQIGICDDKPDDLRLIETAFRSNAEKVGIPIPVECTLFQDSEEMYKEMGTNQRYIEDVGKQEIRLMDGTVLEMGRDRRKALIQEIYRYEGGKIWGQVSISSMTCGSYSSRIYRSWICKEV